VFTGLAGWRSAFVLLGAVFILARGDVHGRYAARLAGTRAGRFQPVAIHAELLRRPAVRWRSDIGMCETFFFFGAYVFLGALPARALRISASR